MARFDDVLNDPIVEARLSELVAEGHDDAKIWSIVETEFEFPARRPTLAEHAAFREELRAIVAAARPMNVRSVFYQAVGRGLVTKTETPGYDRVHRGLTTLRRKGQIPYEWIIDNTRWTLAPTTFLNVADALTHAAERYRKSLWTDEPSLVRFFLEKEGLTRIVSPITARYDVPLCVARGFSSLSFIHDTAMEIRDETRPVYFYHLGDFDNSGRLAWDAIMREIQGFAPNVDLHFERVAVTDEQIKSMGLPTRPAKKTPGRKQRYDEDYSVELDTLPTNVLRNLVEETINRHMSKDRLAELLEEEREEREQLVELIDIAKAAL